VKGQLTGLEVAADQQVAAGAGGGDQGPGIPALARGAGPCGADLPAAGSFSSRVGPSVRPDRCRRPRGAADRAARHGPACHHGNLAMQLRDIERQAGVRRTL
jgi:hypothetical protein